MVLVAIAMVAIIAMAALSIDVVTLYLAREEAQRSADAAALGAARVLSAGTRSASSSTLSRLSRSPPEWTTAPGMSLWLRIIRRVHRATVSPWESKG